MISNELAFLLLAFVCSSLFQSFLAYYIFRQVFNPVFLINVLIFLHNWSFSLGSFFDESVSWGAARNITLDTQVEVLQINLVGLWVAFICLILFCKNNMKVNGNAGLSRRKSNFCLFVYFLLTAFTLGSLIIGSSSGLYGEGQAATSKEAFSPFVIFLKLRIVFISIFFILNRKRHKALLVFITFIELFNSALSGDRKELIVFFIGSMLPYLDEWRLNIKGSLKAAFMFFFIGFFIVFVMVFRTTSGDQQNVYDRLAETSDRMGSMGWKIFLYMSYAANSEGVQNWVYRLMDGGELSQMNGKTYIQAVVNTVIPRPYQGDVADWQAAYVFKSVAYPDVTNQGYDFSFTSEAILNWGSEYSFISFLILSLIISCFYNRRGAGSFRVLYYLSWGLLFIYFRTDSTSLLRMYSMIIFALVILSFLSERFSQKSKSFLAER